VAEDWINKPDLRNQNVFVIDPDDLEQDEDDLEPVQVTHDGEVGKDEPEDEPSIVPADGIDGVEHYKATLWVTTIKMPIWMVDVLDEVAFRERKSRSELIREAVEYYLKYVKGIELRR
jgi:hypothetical protein